MREIGAIGFYLNSATSYIWVMQNPSTFPLISAAFAAAGIPIEQLFERAGVAIAAKLDTSDFFKLWSAADEQFGDPAAGLHFGASGIASGPDFRLAMQSWFRSLDRGLPLATKWFFRTSPSTQAPR